uniref:3-beta hydroxysteroid dehydrogenase/isomerase domain-containing protein n=1 Tax=Meleagris gallopavo TaxID=9103 RepID=A0A803Y156_MELGA
MGPYFAGNISHSFEPLLSLYFPLQCFVLPLVVVLIDREDLLTYLYALLPTLDFVLWVFTKTFLILVYCFVSIDFQTSELHRLFQRHCLFHLCLSLHHAQHIRVNLPFKQITKISLTSPTLETGITIGCTQMLLEACARGNVQHFIYTSSIEVAGPNCKGDPIFNGDEDTPYESTSRFPYAQSKRLAEESVLKADGQMLKDGGMLVTCALRSMYIFGEGCPFLQGHLDKCLLNKNIYLRFSRKEALVNPVYVGNIAWAHVQVAKALQVPQKARHIRGQYYYISDDTPHMSYADLNYELTKELGFGIEPWLPMPLTMLYYFSLLLEIVSFMLRPFVRYIPSTNRHLVTLLNTPFTFSYRKAQRDFGYVPRYTWEEAKRYTSQWIASIVPQRREYLKSKKA